MVGGLQALRCAAVRRSSGLGGFSALVAAKQLMTGNGYTQKQIRNAREHLSIVTARSGFGSDTVVSWSLPQAQGDFALFRPAKSPETLHASEETEIGADEMVI